MMKMGVISLILLCCTGVDAASIVADHRAVEDFKEIPDYWIDLVKHMVLVHTGGSHGRQIPYGLAGIKALDGRYGVEISLEGVDEYRGELRVSRALRSQWNSWFSTVDTTDFWDGAVAMDNVRRTLDYHISQGHRVDAILHTWCWDFREISQDKIDEYLDAMQILQAEYPEVTFIYMSDTNNKPYNPYNEDEHWGYNWFLRRNQIRNFVQANDYVMFDFGELETWSSDGTDQNTFVDWYYEIELPIMHWDWVGEYDGGEGKCHFNQSGTVMKAKAMWWLLARLAGWDGCAAVEGDVTGDCRVKMDDYTTMAEAWQSALGAPNWNELCDLAPEGGDGLIGLGDLAVMVGQWLASGD